MDIAATLIFALAIVHTFLAPSLLALIQTNPRLSGLWQILGDFELIFAFWALVLISVILIMEGGHAAIVYIGGMHFQEPIFVLVIMTIAAADPILRIVTTGTSFLSRLVPLPSGAALYFSILVVVPLLGSLITEPAAITLAALMLSERFFAGSTQQFRYFTLGVLLVNVSVGGVLTSFAAPPVLMISGRWGWDTPFMLKTFGWQVASTVIVNSGLATIISFKELATRAPGKLHVVLPPWWVGLIHVVLLILVIWFSQNTAVQLILLTLFLIFARIRPKYQAPLLLREASGVAIFLLGLIILGGKQHWWLQSVLANLNQTAAYFGAVVLTAVVDNAALTYLASLAGTLSDAAKINLVAGAVTGGGLTIIANAPNPAGVKILQRYFKDGVRPVPLFASSLIPTSMAILIFALSGRMQ